MGLERWTISKQKTLNLFSCLSHQHYAIYCRWREKCAENKTWLFEATLNAVRTSFLPPFLEEMPEVCMMLVLLQMLALESHKKSLYCAKIIFRQQKWGERVRKEGFSVSIQLRGPFSNFLFCYQNRFYHCTRLSPTALYLKFIKWTILYKDNLWQCRKKNIFSTISGLDYIGRKWQ